MVMELACVVAVAMATMEIGLFTNKDSDGSSARREK